MSDPSKHHYIPAFYLRQWATNGFLCEMRKVRGKIIVHKKAPDGTGYQKDLYKIEGVPPHIAQHFERTFMQMVDTEAANVMRKIPAGRTAQWSVRERDAWVRFILSLLFRSPEAVAVIKEEMKRIWVQGLQNVRNNYESYRRPDDPQTAEEYISRTDPNAPAIAASNFLQSMMNSERIANGILDLHWGRVNFPNSRWTLVTSDRPLVFRTAYGKRTRISFYPLGRVPFSRPRTESLISKPPRLPNNQIWCAS